MSCPKCGSDNIATNNKGYGIGKGVIGAALMGPLGLIAGNIGKHDIKCTCLDCGYQWDLKKQIKQQEFDKMINNMGRDNEQEYDSNGQMNIVLGVIVIIIAMVLITGNISSKDDSNTSYNSVNTKQTVETTQTNNLYTGNLTLRQIDDICTTSLGEVNCNAKSNYTRISTNQKLKKYIYKSKETGYNYECVFPNNNHFYIYGEGWQDIIPKGTIYNGKTSETIDFELYDPGFKITHNFTIHK